MTVWVAAENVRVGEDSYIRGVIGVFATENIGDMVGPLILGDRIPESRPWPGAYYPVAIRMGLV